MIQCTYRIPRHIWGHGFVKVGDTDLKRRFQVSWCEIINYSIITIIKIYYLFSGTPGSFREMLIPFYPRYSSGI
jgi:hypothetical protein